MLGSLPNLSSADSVHNSCQSRCPTLPLLMLMTTPSGSSSRPNSPQLNPVSLPPPFLPMMMTFQPAAEPVSFDHVSAIADDLSARSWTQFPSITFLPLRTTFQLTDRPGFPSCLCCRYSSFHYLLDGLPATDQLHRIHLPRPIRRSAASTSFFDPIYHGLPGHHPRRLQLHHRLTSSHSDL